MEKMNKVDRDWFKAMAFLLLMGYVFLSFLVWELWPGNWNWFTRLIFVVWAFLVVQGTSKKL